MRVFCSCVLPTCFILFYYTCMLSFLSFAFLYIYTFFFFVICIVVGFGRAWNEQAALAVVIAALRRWIIYRSIFCLFGFVFVFVQRLYFDVVL